MYQKVLTIIALSFWLIAGLFMSSAYAVAEDNSKTTDRESVKVTVQVNWHHQFQFAGFYAALAKGYYRELGLDVEIKSWRPGINVREEVVAGRATFATAYSSVIADFIKGEPIQAVMTSFQYSPMVLLSKEPVSELNQLSGKTVSHYNNLQILALLNRAEHEIDKSTREVPPSGDLQDFIQGRVDLYGAYETNEPFQLNELGIDYHIVNPNLFGINSAEDFVIVSKTFAQQNPIIVESFREATIKGWRYAIANQQEIVDYIINNYPLVKSRQALLYEARATTKYVRSGNTPIGGIEKARLLATAAEARDAGLISQAEFQDFLPERLIVQNSNKLNLTQAELNYLAENPIVRIGNDVNWEPFEFVDGKGQYLGMVADYFKLFEQRLGVKFQPVLDKAWPDVIDKTRQGKIDLLSAAVATPERELYLKFTRPYLSFPMVLVGRQDTLYVDDYKSLAGNKVAVVRGYWSHEHLKQNYPQLELFIVENVVEGLEAVLSGQALVYSGNLAVINFTARKHGFTGLSVVGQSDQRFELAIGVQQDNPLLLSIMQKALDSLSEQEHNSIYRKWIKMDMVSRLDRKQLLHLALIAGLVLLVMSVWLISYRYQKKRMQSYIDQVHELTYASLLDARSHKLEWVSQSYCQLTGYSRQELLEKSFIELVAEDMSSSLLDLIAQKLHKGQSWSGEVQGVKKGGEKFWVELTLSPEKNLFGRVTKIWATRVDITDKKRIEQLSIRDELTGVYNRRYLKLVFDRELRRLQREKGVIALALFDLDYFKQINDFYGHQKGDQVLQAVADLTRQYFKRPNDFIFRIGGEEFLILAKGSSKSEFKVHLNAFCQALVAIGIENKQSELGVLSVSIGANLWCASDLGSFEQAYQQVDKALYQAKSLGRNQVVMAD